MDQSIGKNVANGNVGLIAPNRLIEKDFDLVYGNERAKEHERWRNAGSSLARYFYRTVFRSRVSPTSFRIMRRQLMESILPYNLNYTYIDGLLAWNTQSVGSVLVDHHERRAGRSGYSVGKLVLLALNLFTNFSLLPLQFVSLCGFLAAFAGSLALSLAATPFLRMLHRTPR